MSEFNICGVLVHARPGQAEQVSACLKKLTGVEVHSVTENSRLVITIEGDTRGMVADTMSGFNKVEHVLSTSMIYQYSDTDTDTDTDIKQEMSA